jgi:VanZ family protein
VANPSLTKPRGVAAAWLPPILWMGLIFIASTDLMSAEHTSRFIGPFLRWLNPNISAAAILQVQFAVRKAAHVTEYAILGCLFWRALRRRRTANSFRWSEALISFALAAAYAAVDEFHQTFVASRTGSPWDVMIDCCGVAIGLLICGISFRHRDR